MLVTEVTNMKESIIKEIEQKLLRYLDNAQMEILHKTLTQCLDNVDISIKNENFEEIFDYSNAELIEKFISSKEIEGCSVRTIKYYKSTLEMLDRVLVSTEWEIMFPLTTVQTRDGNISDHTPLVLNTGVDPPNTQPSFQI